MSRLSFSRLLLVLTLVLSAMLANAGRYVVTYTGGTIDYPDGTSESFTTKNLTDVNTGVGYEERSGGFDSRLHPQGGHLHGTITAKLDWQGTGSPPDQIVVEEAAYSNEYGEDDRIPMADYVLTTATTGIGGETQTTFFFGSPTQYPRNWSWISGGSVRRYSVIANPGPHIQTQLSCSPEASVYPRYPWVYDANYGYIYSDDWSWSCQASYRVRALPVTIALGGGTSQTPGNYLVGQRMTADLYVPFGLVPTASGSTPAYQWSIGSVAFNASLSGDEYAMMEDGDAIDEPASQNDNLESLTSIDPFKSFEWTRSSSPYNDSHGVRHDLTASDYRLSILQVCFAQRADQVGVSCAAHLSVPSGALPTTGLDVSAMTIVGIRTPEVLLFSARWTTSLSLVNPSSRNSSGFGGTVEWTATVNTPTEFVSGSDSGGWLWAQTITLNSTRTLNDGVTMQTKQMGPDSGGDYHLNGIDINFGYYPYVPASGDQSSPGTFTAPDGIQLYYANYKDANNQDHILCDSTMAKSGDGPGEVLNGDTKSYHFGNQFTTWLMYRPPGIGSQFVPLQAFGWTYGGDVTWDGTNGPWTLSNAAPATITPISLTGDPTLFPRWDRILRANKIIFRANDAHTLP